ncbi:DUF2384 domain-containing protein [Halopseudomonas laoshanensis]|uniref:DUF2384 domain-containing protein n=1 Tax=Halopseudomonas laoshanensis TaxID=2268758 RepID=A0A7V7GVK9_9GAMM|nr:MbcA/ParS/Xre antitoxin family protein [Halopseudomonas laoshanensis]KAA0696112.1 DUF2384 domain-containing protein [Halopseudomonas laoshanensis]
MTDDAYSDHVLNKAVTRICIALELEQWENEILVAKGASQSGVLGGDQMQFPRTAAMITLVQIYQLLLAITGADAAARCWLRTMNDVLGGAPLDLMKTHEGLEIVLHYLESISLR